MLRCHLTELSLNQLLSFCVSRSMLAVSQRRYRFLSSVSFYNSSSESSLVLHSLCLSIFPQVMWNAAVHAEYLHDHNDYGFDVGNVRFSWE